MKNQITAGFLLHPVVNQGLKRNRLFFPFQKKYSRYTKVN